MSNRRAASRYAEALLQVAQSEQQIEPIRQELTALAAAVEAAPELQDFLARPDLEVEEKEQAIVAIFGTRFSETIISLLRVLLHHRRGPELPAVSEVYNELADQVEGRVQAEARTVVPLTPPQRERLITALSRMTGKTVILQETLDPRVLAGVSLKVGDRLIDGSAAGRLERMREALLEARD